MDTSGLARPISDRPGYLPIPSGSSINASLLLSNLSNTSLPEHTH